jgi:hypothetical protein
MLNRAVVAALVFAAAAFLLYLANLAREALSPNEPYAASIGLSPDQCAAAQNGLSPADARAYCRRPVPKRL